MTWKKARVIFLHKGHPKPVNEAGSFRLISLLDGAGKLLEKLILNRISASLESSLARNQYGFQRDMGTLEAIDEVLRVVALAARVWPGTDICVPWSHSMCETRLILLCGTSSTRWLLGLASHII